MNATSLYVSTCRLILQADTEDPSTWQDLYRLVPYLRQSLSCTVCGNLLIEPHTPSTETNCQHHVCRGCRGGRKRLKPTCGWCKDYSHYSENTQLRILLQCYKKLCEYLTSTQVYRCLLLNLPAGNSGSLAELIQEGAGFRDNNYKSNAGLSKSAYSILPCVYTSSISTQTQSSNSQSGDSSRGAEQQVTVQPQQPAAAIKSVSNGSEIYSVMYAGTGNKITIKRKAAVIEETVDKTQLQQQETVLPQQQQSGPMIKCMTASQLYNNEQIAKKPKLEKPPNSFKKPRSGTRSKRKGCRCGNATAVPGKLTCCGQRCPCYVESKPCLECRCRGCRNPHTPEGYKIRPHIPELQNLQLQLTGPMEAVENCPQSQEQQPVLNVRPCYTTSASTPPTIKLLSVYQTPTKINIKNIAVPSSIPNNVMIKNEVPRPSGSGSEGDESDVQIDV